MRPTRATGSRMTTHAPRRSSFVSPGGAASPWCAATAYAKTIAALLGASFVAACASSTPSRGAEAGAALRLALKDSMIEVEGGPRARFALARELGFEGVEVDRPSGDDVAALAAAARETGLVIHGVIDSQHWTTRFSDPDPVVRARAVEILRGALLDAHALGATTVLVVPGAVRDPVREDFDAVWSRSREAIGGLVPLARSLGVKIAVEVVWNDFLTTPEDYVRYLDSFADLEPGVPLGERTVGAYYDCSNMIKYGVPPARWIDALGPRLLKVDFKGYHRVRGWVPIGEGDEDWPAVRAALARVGYRGFVTAEVEGGGRAALADVKARMDRVLAP